MYKTGDLRTDEQQRLWLLSGTKGWVAVQDMNGCQSYNAIIKQFEFGIPDAAQDDNRLLTIETHMNNLTSLLEDAYETISALVTQLNDLKDKIE